MSEFGHEKCLPPGLSIARRLGKLGTIGEFCEVEDERSGDGTKYRRTALFVEMPPDASWTTPLKMRSGQLLGRQFAHVDCPSESYSAADDRRCWIDGEARESLAARLTAGGAFKSDQAMEIFRNILCGLRELHAREIWHGGLHSSCILVEDSDATGGAPIAYVGQTLMGPLPWWSDSKWIDRDAANYYPPDFKRKPRSPSAKDDLYAAGLLLCEMVLGPRLLATADAAPSDRAAAWQSIAKQLQQVNAGTDLRQMAAALLNPAQPCPANARDALKIYDELPRQRLLRTRLLPVGIIAALSLCIAILMGVMWNMSRNNLEIAIKEKEAAVQQLGKANATNVELQGQVNGYKAAIAANEKEIDGYEAKFNDIATLEQRIEVLKGQSPKFLAQQWWRANFNRDLKVIIKDFEGSTFPPDKTKEAKAFVAGWINSLDQLDSAATGWLDSSRMSNPDPAPAASNLRALFEKACKEPWSDNFANAEIRLCVLNEAHKEWQKWADDATIADMNSLRARIAAGNGLEEQKVLKAWLDEIAQTKQYSFDLNRGDSPNETDESRVFTLYVADNPVPSTPWGHSWPGAKAIKFNGRVDARFPFAWRSGELVEVLLERDSSVWTGWRRPNLIKHVDSHPLAIWRLQRSGSLTQDGVTLDFTISGALSGPPPKKPFARGVAGVGSNSKERQQESKE